MKTKPCPNCGRLGVPHRDGHPEHWLCVTEVSCCRSFFTSDDSDLAFRSGKYASTYEVSDE